MTELLCLNDSYLREFHSKVLSVDGSRVELEHTAFYPTGGGQPNDTGKLVLDGKEFSVVDVKKESGKVYHYLSSPVGLNTGASVDGKIDWERRYALMRMHTAAHILASVFHSSHRALITGNQLGTEKTRFDFSIPDFDKQKIEECINEANEAIARHADVKVYFLPREEAFKIPNVVKLAGALPPAIGTLRIVEIEGIDIQADGGTHVKNTREIGKIELLSMENKGKDNRRVYFKTL